MTIVREKVVGEAESVSGEKMDLVLRECVPPANMVGPRYFILDKDYRDGGGSVRVADVNSWADGLKRAQIYLETNG